MVWGFEPLVLVEGKWATLKTTKQRGKLNIRDNSRHVFLFLMPQLPSLNAAPGTVVLFGRATLQPLLPILFRALLFQYGYVFVGGYRTLFGGFRGKPQKQPPFWRGPPKRPHPYMWCLKDTNHRCHC